MQDYCATTQVLSGTGSIGGVSTTYDASVFTNHMRNAIYFVATGLNANDTFRVEVKITYEYVPTTTFRVWADDEGPRANNSDYQMLKEVAIHMPAI